MAEDDPDTPPSLVEWTRRAALSQGTRFATGAGATLFGVMTLGSAARYGDRQEPARGASAAGAISGITNVADFGATGDGDTDDTASLQEAIDATRKKGGVVFFPPGIYLTKTLTLYSGIHLRGSGGEATTLRLKPGTNAAIIESDGFAKLTGSGGRDGITMFSVRDLALDGNKAKNPKGGYGLRIFGYGYEITEVVAYDCQNDGIYSEWGKASGLPSPSHQMESRLSGLRTHDNNGNGITFNGPHDSMFVNCVSALNNGAGFLLSGYSGSTSMVNCHAWGLNQDTSFVLDATGLACVNCYADLNGGVGVQISRNNVRWVGGVVLGGNHQPPAEQEIGVQLRSGAFVNEPAGVLVDTMVVNCGTAAVDFGGDRGRSTIRMTTTQPGVRDSTGKPVPGTGLGWIGNPAPTTQVEIVNALGDTNKNLVIRPAFDMRSQGDPHTPGADTIRFFARNAGGKMQLCASFPGGAVRVIAAEP